MPMPAPAPHAPDWRHSHIGHWLRLAHQRFDARVLELLAHHPGTPLALSNLVLRQQLGAAHIHITRHLAHGGMRLTELARQAGMTKQAMLSLVGQCEAWGMVQRLDDPADARAKRIAFTPLGLSWLQAYQDAVLQTEAELTQSVGEQVATVLSLGLEAYCSS